MHFLILSAVVSLVLMVGGLFAVRWLLVHLPATHFVDRPRRHPIVHGLRGILSVVLILAGIAMLVLPGPGIVTILLGASLLDLPLQRRIVVSILRRPRVRHAIDGMRSRAGRAPFVLPEHVHSPSHA